MTDPSGKLNTDSGILKKFGITMGAVLSVFALIVFIRRGHAPSALLVISAAFFIFGIVLPRALKPLYVIWMRLAFVLGWINMRLILMMIFYLVVTPIGLFLKVLNIDLLDIKMGPGDSFWKKKENSVFNPSDYERRF